MDKKKGQPDRYLKNHRADEKQPLPIEQVSLY
jgi:hypothetical protein